MSRRYMDTDYGRDSRDSRRDVRVDPRGDIRGDPRDPRDPRGDLRVDLRGDFRGDIRDRGDLRDRRTEDRQDARITPRIDPRDERVLDSRHPRAYENLRDGRGIDSREDRRLDRRIDARDPRMDMDLDQDMDIDMDRGMGRGMDRRLDRGMDRDMDRDMDRGLDSRDRLMDRGLDSRDRLLDHGLDSRDRLLDRGLDSRDRGMDRGLDNRDRVLDRGLDSRDRGIDRGIDRGMDSRDRVLDRGLDSRDRFMDRTMERGMDRPRDRPIDGRLDRDRDVDSRIPRMEPQVDPRIGLTTVVEYVDPRTGRVVRESRPVANERYRDDRDMRDDRELQPNRRLIDPNMDARARDDNPKTNEYFLPLDGITREVIQFELCRYLGQDATVRPGTHPDGRKGYLIRAYRALTTAMIDTLKDDSSKWELEKQKRHRQGRPQGTYGQSSTAEDRGRRTAPIEPTRFAGQQPMDIDDDDFPRRSGPPAGNAVYSQDPNFPAGTASYAISTGLGREQYDPSSQPRTTETRGGQPSFGQPGFTSLTQASIPPSSKTSYADTRGLTARVPASYPEESGGSNRQGARR